MVKCQLVGKDQGHCQGQGPDSCPLARVRLVRGKIRMSKEIKGRVYVSKDWSSIFLFCHQVSVGWGTPPGQSRSCSWTSKLCLKMKIVLWRMPLVQWSLWAGPLPPLNDNGLRNGGDSKANIVQWIFSFHDHCDSHYDDDHHHHLWGGP